ncbi:MAG: ArdC family protein [Verrucomicrobiota bacterium]
MAKKAKRSTARSEEAKAKAKAKRAELCRKTAPFRNIIGANLSALLNGKELPFPRYAGCETLNDCLQVDYSRQTGENEWSSFRGWKEKGFSVKKGEKGFMIWSRPKEFKETVEVKNVQTGEVSEEEQKSMRFSIAYIFHAGQVQDESGNYPKSHLHAKVRELLKPLPLALPAPQESNDHEQAA